MANWAELHQDILILIAKTVHFWEDFSVFRRVCRSWRSVAVKKNFKGCPQFPWLMLAEENNTDYRGLVSPTEGNLIGKLLLPEAKGKRCFESLGWFITVSETGDMNLLDPVSRVQIPLPHISTLKRYPEGNKLTACFGYIRKAVLSSRPCVSSKDTKYVLMVIHKYGAYLGFWRPGDKVWTNVKTLPGAYSVITYYNGQFYTVNSMGHIFVCDVGGRDPIVVAHPRGEIPCENFKFKRLYIVESNGELLVVVRNGYDLDYSGDYVTAELYDDEEVDEYRVGYGTTGFGVFKELGLQKGFSLAEILDEAEEFSDVKRAGLDLSGSAWEVDAERAAHLDPDDTQIDTILATSIGDLETLIAEPPKAALYTTTAFTAARRSFDRPQRPPIALANTPRLTSLLLQPPMLVSTTSTVAHHHLMPPPTTQN
ncbi:hypothetical protein Vadar_015841 [Vaccinium darrowii]|uniref:Uncharacterized protein n=1 Tax=Vaccinium darrowii TaxID=229202 RepID=A0ACB7XI63_9ERIC|nr:hypothetical protein Vadar_015841 [Vaccinium darrowii]